MADLMRRNYENIRGRITNLLLFITLAYNIKIAYLTGEGHSYVEKHQHIR